MAHTIVQFDGYYYMVDGNEDEDNRGLTIGGYESAWLADLVMSYFLAKMQPDVWNDIEYFGIYRDDGIAIGKGNWSPSRIGDWLKQFQNSIDGNGGKGRL